MGSLLNPLRSLPRVVVAIWAAVATSIGERSIGGLALRIGRPHAESLRAEFIR